MQNFNSFQKMVASQAQSQSEMTVFNGGEYAAELADIERMRANILATEARMQERKKQWKAKVAELHELGFKVTTDNKFLNEP